MSNFPSPRSFPPPGPNIERAALRCTLSNYPPPSAASVRATPPPPPNGRIHRGKRGTRLPPPSLYSPHYTLTPFPPVLAARKCIFLIFFFSPEEVSSRRKEAGSGASNSFFPFLYIRDFLCSSLFFSSFAPCCEGTRSELSVLNPLLPRKSPLR